MEADESSGDVAELRAAVRALKEQNGSLQVRAATPLRNCVPSLFRVAVVDAVHASSLSGEKRCFPGGPPTSAFLISLLMNAGTGVIFENTYCCCQNLGRGRGHLKINCVMNM